MKNFDREVRNGEGNIKPKIMHEPLFNHFFDKFLFISLFFFYR